ncbi:MAG: 3-dehydroquinate synthase family protein [Bdellovibrionia bacterium]
MMQLAQEDNVEELKLAFVDKMPSPATFGPDILVIYDQVLEKKHKAWIQKFKYRYPVKAGESLKNLDKFPQHVAKISKLIGHLPVRNLTVLAVGGGSVGDFAGFFASVYKRGVKLIHLPSTWLAAIDSAHGGKNALNVGKTKNQIGTFYNPTEIYLCQDLLFSQPVVRAHEAFAEIFKIALLTGEDFWRQFSEIQDCDHNHLWKFLGTAIEAKYRVVAEDPYEETGYRHLLNFGHTFGHVVELTHGMPHGIAVNVGLHFALLWSVEKKYLSTQDYHKIINSPAGKWLMSVEPFVGAKFLKSYLPLLEKDKKKASSQSVRFIFLREPGSPIIEPISLKEFEKFYLKLLQKFARD